MCPIEYYTVKKSIVSFFNYLRNRRPVEATGNKVASCFDIVAGVDRVLDIAVFVDRA